MSQARQSSVSEGPAESYRSELPAIPAAIRALPVARGYPVPWFVPWIDGKPEFRMGSAAKLAQAVRERRCWVCGQALERFYAFVIGPTCTINRISAEPPVHAECGDFSALACPFLNGRQQERREGGLPKAAPEVGVMIRRNPGCCAVWETASHLVERTKGGVLFRIGNPSAVRWFAHGRRATRSEVEESIRTGYPILLREAAADGQAALDLLAVRRRSAERFLPARGKQ